MTGYWFLFSQNKFVNTIATGYQLPSSSGNSLIRSIDITGIVFKKFPLGYAQYLCIHTILIYAETQVSFGWGGAVIG